MIEREYLPRNSLGSTKDTPLAYYMKLIIAACLTLLLWVSPTPSLGQTNQLYLWKNWEELPSLVQTIWLEAITSDETEGNWELCNGGRAGLLAFYLICKKIDSILLKYSIWQFYGIGSYDQMDLLYVELGDKAFGIIRVEWTWHWPGSLKP